VSREVVALNCVENNLTISCSHWIERRDLETNSLIGHVLHASSLKYAGC
jgi:hypothetical protein